MEIKLGKKLQVLRRERGLTQEDIAGIFNVTNQSVSKWENDLACPDISLLPEIADYFKISVDELLGYKPSSSINSIYLDIDALFTKATEKEKAEYVYKISKFASIAMWNDIESVKREENRMIEGKDVYSSSISSTNSGCNIYAFNSCFVSWFENYPEFNNKSIRIITNLMKEISDLDTLKVIFKLHKETVNGFNIGLTKDMFISDINIKEEKFDDIIEKLLFMEIISETDNRYILEKIHIVPILVTLMVGMKDFDSISF